MRCISSSLAVALFSLLLSAVPATAEPAGLKPLPLGAAAPDFNLPGVDGRSYRLQDFAEARILVVIFTCNHCPTPRPMRPDHQAARRLQGPWRRGGGHLANDPLAVRLDELATPTWATRSRT